jgi:radical SAM superfamily enzyme
MGRQHLRNPLKLLSHAEYVDVVVSFLERLNPDIVIQRLSGEAPLHVLIAPNWGKRYPEIVQDIDTEMEKRDTWQGKYYKQD